jgi:hypothetical protein
LLTYIHKRFSPEEFLREQVLTQPKAQAALKLWLSAARSQYVLNFKWARRPKIWLLTGLYLLEDTRTVVNKAQGAEVSVGISSALVGALSSVPIGGGVSLAKESSWQMAMEMEGKHVWAAQYRMVDAKYVSVSGRQTMDLRAAPSLPSSMSLYKDILSVNDRRGAEDTEEVHIGLHGVEDTAETKYRPPGSLASSTYGWQPEQLQQVPPESAPIQHIAGQSRQEEEPISQTELRHSPVPTQPRLSELDRLQVDRVYEVVEVNDKLTVTNENLIPTYGDARRRKPVDLENDGETEEDDEVEEDYIERLEEAIQTFEEAPPSLLG